MPTKQKPQTTHTCTQRLIETNTYTNTDTHTHTRKHRNVKIFNYNKRKTNSIEIFRFACLFTINRIYKTHSEINISVNK